MIEPLSGLSGLASHLPSKHLSLSVEYTTYLPEHTSYLPVIHADLLSIQAYLLCIREQPQPNK